MSAWNPGFLTGGFGLSGFQNQKKKNQSRLRAILDSWIRIGGPCDRTGVSIRNKQIETEAEGETKTSQISAG